MTDLAAEDSIVYFTSDNPLIRYVRDNNIHGVKQLLDEAERCQDDRWMFAFFVAENPDGLIEHTVLSYACELNHGELVRLFIEYGMDPSLQSDDFQYNSISIGTNVLVSSVMSENYDLLRYWIEDIGIDINVTDQYGVSLLMLIPGRNTTKAHRFSEFVVYLAKHGANLYQINKNGNTALIWAVESGDLPVVRFLIECGDMDIHHRNKLGETALSTAISAKYQHILTYFTNIIDGK